MDDETAVKVADSKSTSLRLKDCKNMTDYLNQHTLLDQDCEDAGQPRGLDCKIKNIVGGLGSKYSTFLTPLEIQSFIEYENLPALTNVLLQFEDQLVIEERAAEQVEAEVKLCSGRWQRE